jgi:hypothetical protein
MSNQTRQSTESNQLQLDDDTSKDMPQKGSRVAGVFVMLVAIILVGVGMYARHGKSQQPVSVVDET